MSGVKLVNWPKDANRRNKWKRLIKREGKDPSWKLEYCRTHLCSRHLDAEQITMHEESTGDPKYFI